MRFIQKSPIESCILSPTPLGNHVLTIRTKSNGKYECLIPIGQLIIPVGGYLSIEEEADVTVIKIPERLVDTLNDQLKESYKPKTLTVLLLGTSGVGKDTAQKYLSERYSLIPFHPHWPARNQMEDYYGFERGWLRTSEGKAHKPLGANMTMGEMLVAEFHHRELLDPLYTSRYMNKVLNPKIGYCIQGIRKKEEAQTILGKLENHKIVCIYLTSSNQSLSSDREVLAIADHCKKAAKTQNLTFVTIHNMVKSHICKEASLTFFYNELERKVQSVL